MEKPTLDPEEWIISLRDVKQLYISMWKKLLKWAVVGGILAFFYFGNTIPKYKAAASFKGAVEQVSPNDLIKEFMGRGASSNQPLTISCMKSHQVLRPLVEKMGLQISLQESSWRIPRVIRNFRETLKAEKGLKLKDPDPFFFQDVLYEGEKSFSFHVSFTDSDHFTIYSADKKEEIGKGTLGVAVRLADPSCVQFTLVKTPRKLKIGFLYPFHTVHWASAVGSLQGQIKVKVDKESPSIIHISACHRDRHLATRIANELMQQYQFYLKREYDHVAQEQIGYLERRQEQACGKLNQLFDQYTAYLGKNLRENGFTGLEQESQSLLVPYQQMHSKWLSIEVELSRLDQVEKGGKALALAADGSLSQGLSQIFQKMQDFQHQRDLLELSLCQVADRALEIRREDLKKIRDQQYAVEKLMQEIDRGEEISSFDLDQGLYDWAKAVRDPEEREDFAEYLENYARLLSMKEKMLQERFFYGSRTPVELEGIDLSSARALFLEYNSKLDMAEASMRHYAQLKREIPHPDFDLASLSSILKDPLCQKIIAEAGHLGLQLKDEKHHNSKEGQRWEEEIALCRKVLAAHLDQLHKVEKLNTDLIREKMAGLQKVSLDCIHRQISVLHEQARDFLKSQKQALLLEREILERRMENIRSRLASVFPEKWRFEKWLAMKTDMTNRIMQTVTEVVESRTLANNLHHVESKPLDYALVPTSPIPPRLRQMTYLGAFIFPFFVFCLAFIRQILRGFPVSLEKLKVFRLPVLGSLSTFCDGPSVETPSGSDLELLRQLAIFTDGGKVISLIGGRGPDYSYALGENLARMSVKSIILRCDFLSKFQKEDCPGLIQIWKGDIGEPPIRKGKGFDYITAGGYSPFGTEIVQSQSFHQLIELFSKNYDQVFLLFRSPLTSAESMAALRICEKAIVTVSGEQIEELTPFVNWAYDENRCRLTFIIRS